VTALRNKTGHQVGSDKNGYSYTNKTLVFVILYYTPVMFDDFSISFTSDSTHPCPLGISEGRYELKPKASGANGYLQNDRYMKSFTRCLNNRPAGA
jgi:hypothetical protein